MNTEYEQVNGAVANALQAEVDALRKDAERYRWLREHGHPDSDSGIAVGIERLGDWGKWTTDYPLGGNLDSAIDAAMNGANT